MSDELTISPGPFLPVRVRVRIGEAWTGEQRFTQTFRLGRSAECHVVVPERVVSRVHAEVRCEAGQWWLIDQQSTHGLYVNGRQIARLLLQQAVTIELGLGGPTVWLAVGDQVPFFDQPSDVAQAGDQLPSVTEIVERWKRGDTAAEGEGLAGTEKRQSAESDSKNVDIESLSGPSRFYCSVQWDTHGTSGPESIR